MQQKYFWKLFQKPTYRNYSKENFELLMRNTHTQILLCFQKIPPPPPSKFKLNVSS